MYSKRTSQLIGGMKSFDMKKQPSYSKILRTIVLDDSFERRHQESSSCLLTYGPWSRDIACLSGLFSPWISRSLHVYIIRAELLSAFKTPQRKLQAFILSPLFLSQKLSHHRILQLSLGFVIIVVAIRMLPKERLINRKKLTYTKEKTASTGVTTERWSFKTWKLYTKRGWELTSAVCLPVLNVYSSKEVSVQLLKHFLSL